MFRTIFTTLRALLKSGLCATQLCIRSDTASYAGKQSNSKFVIPFWNCVLFKRSQSRTWWKAQWSQFLSLSLEYFPYGNQNHWDLVQMQAIQFRCAWFHTEFVFLREEKLKNKSNCEFRSIFYLYEVLGKSWRRTSLVWELAGRVSKQKHQSSLLRKSQYTNSAVFLNSVKKSPWPPPLPLLFDSFIWMIMKM